MLSGNDITTSTLPFDLIPEILCRLSVKHLLQLKCVCKSWKTLIPDPKFAKKHLHVSKMYDHHHHLIVKGRDILLWDSTISSIFSDAATTSRVPQLQLISLVAISDQYVIYNGVISCDGILLFATDQWSALLWNPSIKKFKILPPFSIVQRVLDLHYTFGYDHFIDNYKVFAVVFRDNSGTYHNEVSVYTLGTDSWRRIDDFPYIYNPIRRPGTFVSGTVNWLASVPTFSFSHVIVSLDLETESYQTLLIPEVKTNPPLTYELMVSKLELGVLRDCLCIFAYGYQFFDVWVMREYGIQGSWTKLFSVPYVGGPPRSSFYTKVVYVSEDHQVLLDFKESSSDLELFVYNSRNKTFKIPRIRNISGYMVPGVYVESLVSPSS